MKQKIIINYNFKCLKNYKIYNKIYSDNDEGINDLEDN